LLIIAAVATGLAVIITPFSLGAAPMWRLIHPGCNNDSRTPADYDLPNYREISIPASIGGSYRGFFISGNNGATVIVPPPYNSSRGGMLPEASLLAKDGFNILIFESRICAGRDVISLGYSEIDDVGDVLTYLKQNPDKLPVNRDKIALHGFSSAGATATMATARYPEIHALLSEGGYHNIDEQLGLQRASGFFDGLMLIGTRAAYRVGAGVDASMLVPIQAIKYIPPRPIFLVYGSSEPSLPGAREQLATARSAVSSPDDIIELWIVPGAGHGGYLAAVGADEYTRHVLPFYHCALLNDCQAWHELWKVK
jgi:dienelactone hydrolase